MRISNHREYSLLSKDEKAGASEACSLKGLITRT